MPLQNKTESGINVLLMRWMLMQKRHAGCEAPPTRLQPPFPWEYCQHVSFSSRCRTVMKNNAYKHSQGYQMHTAFQECPHGCLHCVVVQPAPDSHNESGRRTFKDRHGLHDVKAYRWTIFPRPKQLKKQALSFWKVPGVTRVVAALDLLYLDGLPNT